MSGLVQNSEVDRFPAASQANSARESYGLDLKIVTLVVSFFSSAKHCLSETTLAVKNCVSESAVVKGLAAFGTEVQEFFSMQRLDLEL